MHSLLFSFVFFPLIYYLLCLPSTSSSSSDAVVVAAVPFPRSLSS